MNRRRLLTRLWMIGSVLWVAYAVWLVLSGTTFPDLNLLVIVVFVLGPPTIVFALGRAVAWIMSKRL